MIAVYAVCLPLCGSLAEQRKRMSQGAYALLSYAMREWGYDSKVLTVCRTSEGKPYFADHAIEFSLSHSGEWAVCALSDAPVGVDVERIRPISERVWKRFLAHDANEPYGGDPEAILRWTQYEASLKREGKVTPLPPDAKFTSYDMLPGYLLTVCGVGNVDALRVIPYSELE